EMTGQVGRLNPRQNQKATVIGQMRQATLALRAGPADKLISCCHLPSGRTKEQTSQVLAVAVLHQIMNLSQSIGITQVVMLRQIVCHRSTLGLARLGLV